MPKVDPDILKAFGRAVKLARGKRGWNQKQLGDAFEPPVGNSIISKVEKGQKEALGFTSVGRFTKLLELHESWLEKFLDAEETADSGETKAEREADQIFDRLHREGATEGASDDLLIQLANRFTEGDHKDRETAYVSVRAALEELASNRDIAALAGNADAQFAALMRHVDTLNDEGNFDEAARILDQEQDRLDQVATLHLKKQLSQDRLRNRPDLAAKQLIADQYRQAPPGGVFWAVDRLANTWRNQGDKAGDMFALAVALALAKANYHDRAKGKKRLEAIALHALGWGHLRLAYRSTKDSHLRIARSAFTAAIEKTNKKKDPVNWAARQDGLGGVLLEIGSRASDAAIVQDSVTARRAALTVLIAQKNETKKAVWNNLGISLQALGELSRCDATLQQAVEALKTALNLKDLPKDPLDWGATQSNLALALKWRGEITGELAHFDAARDGYAACEGLDFNSKAPFIWARLHWNIADLAVARFALAPYPAHLIEARNYLAQARAIFVEGSEYQTQRYDELLAKIEAAQTA
ncbi:helix-turn-helix domain-containing protein [Sulfitobacter sp.]|uniref:helix-turn-helix domain-containing protein n=1 Tax=Sulfitobacter sp. TaxID=1903071 RepID=UPI003002BED2